jgi:hypothetical protein
MFRVHRRARNWTLAGFVSKDPSGGVEGAVFGAYIFWEDETGKSRLLCR